MWRLVVSNVTLVTCTINHGTTLLRTCLFKMALLLLLASPLTVAFPAGIGPAVSAELPLLLLPDGIVCFCCWVVCCYNGLLRSFVVVGIFNSLGVERDLMLM